MIKVYLYDLNNLKDISEYGYRQKQARKERRPASSEYKDAGYRELVNLGVTAVLSRALSDCKIAEDDAELIYGEHGKPYLRDYSDVFFNLSHSGRYVMCAAGDVEVGIDIQEHVPDRRHIAGRFFTEYECRMIEDAHDDEEADRIFFDIWTYKESFVKAYGTGIDSSFGDIGFYVSDDAEIHAIYKNAPVDCIMKKYEIPGYSAAVCARSHSHISEIIVISKHQS